MASDLPSSAGTLLVIDDDPLMHSLLRAYLVPRGYAIHSALSFEQAAALRERFSPDDFDLVLFDRTLGLDDGLELLPRLFAMFPHIPVVLITASSATDTVVEAMRRGAFDFLPKPVDEPRLLATVSKSVAHRRLLQRVAVLDNPGSGRDPCFEQIIGAAPAMRAVFSILRHVGPTEVSVMITGESGTGKELVAHAVHRLSRRASGPFVPLNMAALPRELVEATLFGHERGAFTGADRRREGAVGQAQGGTLFLDEIAEMPLEMQSKLLRFLQELVYRPVGASEDVRADVRIISATNRDPLAEVQAGRLRADLYYRLAVVPVQLPPLRHRPGDIPLIATHVLRQAAARYRKQFTSIDPSALERLTAYCWPGNVRELIHLIERIVVLNDGARLTDAMLPPELLAAVPGIAVPGHRAEGANIPPAVAGLGAVPVTFPWTGSVRQALSAFSQSAPPAAQPGMASGRGTFPPGAQTLLEPSRRGPSAPVRPGDLAPAASTAPVPSPTPDTDRGLFASDNIIPLPELERRAVEHALRVCNGSAVLAARKLGLSTATIYRKIKEWGLSTGGHAAGERGVGGGGGAGGGGSTGSTGRGGAVAIASAGPASAVLPPPMSAAASTASLIHTAPTATTPTATVPSAPVRLPGHLATAAVPVGSVAVGSVPVPATLAVPVPISAGRDEELGDDTPFAGEIPGALTDVPPGDAPGVSA